MGSKQRIITFDFDDTLCFKDGTPNHAMIDIVNKYADEGCKCYIVTARNKAHEVPGWITKNQPGRVRVKDFVKDYNLPIKQCHFTNHELKGPVLYNIGSSLHYDDKPEHLRSCLEHGIEALHPIKTGNMDSDTLKYNIIQEE